MCVVCAGDVVVVLGLSHPRRRCDDHSAVHAHTVPIAVDKQVPVRCSTAIACVGTKSSMFIAYVVVCCPDLYNAAP